MFLGTYSIVAEEISSRGLHCKYFKNFSGSQSFNRALILKEVLDQLPAKYDENGKLTLDIIKLPEVGKHNLKQLVFIDPYMMNNLTAFIQRKALYRTMEPIRISVDVYLIKNVFHLRILKVSSRYQTAKCYTSSYVSGSTLKIPNNHYYFKFNPLVNNSKQHPESLSLGQLVAAAVKERSDTELKSKVVPQQPVPAKPDTLLNQVKECVKKVQDTLAQYKVEYQSEKVIDIGVCNSIKPILCIKFKNDTKLEIAVGNLDLVFFKSQFKYNVLKPIFE